MRLSPKLRGFLAGAALVGAAIGAVALIGPAHAAEYDRCDRDCLVMPNQAAQPPADGLSLNGDYAYRSDDPYDRERWTREREERLLGTAPESPMRDGGPAPWDKTPWSSPR